jgi:hypothetical protein
MAMSDLVERLRARGPYADDGWAMLTEAGYQGKPASFVPDPLCAEAAGEIVRLTALVAEISAERDAAMAVIGEFLSAYDALSHGHHHALVAECDAAIEKMRALAQPKGGTDAG